MQTLLRVSLVLVLSAMAGAAYAQQRVFVSVFGNDVNPCIAASPCRSFAHAMTVVLTNGEILAVDSGGFGPVTITQSVSIVAAPGVEASITQGTLRQDAITINVPGATIVLRGLSLYGLGTGHNGILINAADSVVVQSCNITGFANDGISFDMSSPGVLAVNSTFIEGSTFGISTVSPSNDFARFTIDHSQLQGSTAGLYVGRGSRGTISNSSANHNGTGIDVDTQNSNQTALLEIENCVITENNFGVSAEGFGVATVRVSNTLIAHNTITGVSSSNANAHLYTRTNNTVQDNATDGVFTDVFFAK